MLLKKIQVLFVSVLCLLTSSCSHAALKRVPASLSELILGTWKLESFVRIQADAKEVPWCTGVNGYLTYTADGYVSAAINCDPSTPKSAPSKPYRNMLLYTATWSVQSSNVVHHVLNASQLDLIGKDLSPEAKVTETTLVLTGNSGRGDYRIVWKRPERKQP